MLDFTGKNGIERASSLALGGSLARFQLILRDLSEGIKNKAPVPLHRGRELYFNQLTEVPESIQQVKSNGSIAFPAIPAHDASDRREACADSASSTPAAVESSVVGSSSGLAFWCSYVEHSFPLHR
jgi:hypothetical protein